MPSLPGEDIHTGPSKGVQARDPLLHAEIVGTTCFFRRFFPASKTFISAIVKGKNGDENVETVAACNVAICYTDASCNTLEGGNEETSGWCAAKILSRGQVILNTLLSCRSSEIFYPWRAVIHQGAIWLSYMAQVCCAVLLSHLANTSEQGGMRLFGHFGGSRSIIPIFLFKPGRIGPAA